MQKKSGISSEILGKDRERAINEEAERSAEVILRHRREIESVREQPYQGLKTHKAAKNMAEKRLAFEYLKAVKAKTEELQVTQRIERKTHGLDGPQGGSSSFLPLG